MIERITTSAPATSQQPAATSDESDDEPAEAEKDVPEDEDDGTATSTAKSSKSKLKKLVLTPEEEDDLAEWVREHTDVYDKSSKGYKNIDRRKRVWRLKAEEIKVDPASLMAWYENMRTRYVKLVKKKSGDGVKDLTPREDWLIQKFSFLYQHILRRPGKGIATLTSKAKEPRVPPESSASTYIQMGEEDMEADEMIPCDASTPTAPHSRSHSPVPPSRKKVCMASDVHARPLQKINERVETSRRLQDEVQRLVHREDDRPTTEKAHWGQWMASVATNIRDDLWREFQDWSYNGLRYFRDESLRLFTSTASQPGTSRDEPSTQQKPTTSGHHHQ